MSNPSLTEQDLKNIKTAIRQHMSMETSALRLILGRSTAKPADITDCIRGLNEYAKLYKKLDER